MNSLVSYMIGEKWDPGRGSCDIQEELQRDWCTPAFKPLWNIPHCTPLPPTGGTRPSTLLGSLLARPTRWQAFELPVVWRGLCGINVEKREVYTRTGWGLLRRWEKSCWCRLWGWDVLLLALFVHLMNIRWDLNLTREGMENMAPWHPLGRSS